jgi:hypothetical protein
VKLTLWFCIKIFSKECDYAMIFVMRNLMFKRRKRMSRLIVTLTVAIFLGLVGCSDIFSALSASADDPDADGDVKGINYFSTLREPTGNRVFIFDPNYNAWAIYDESGRRVNTGRASGGKLYCPDVGRGCKTIVGKFSIVSKGGPDCKSNRYPVETHGGAPMPYCMYFSPKGYGIHGSYDIPDYNASHGCIRVTPVVAKWLSHNFIEIGTTVIVLPYSRG